MDPNIASITELLEYLSTRFYNVEHELKSNRKHLDRIDRETTENVSENTPRPENHTLRYSVQLDHDGMNLQNIKPEAPTFDGQFDPKIFSIGHQIWIIILTSIICQMGGGSHLPK